MIISIHLPKTARTSFAAAFESHFGAKYFKDYTGALGYAVSDTTLMSLYDKCKHTLEASLRIADMDWSGVECIHGHNFAIKYLLLAQKLAIKFVTWMRNPVDRLISNIITEKNSTIRLHQLFISSSSTFYRGKLVDRDNSVWVRNRRAYMRNCFGDFRWKI